MEKRLLVAIALSFLVLGAYSALFPKSKPIENKHVVDNISSESATPVTSGLPKITPLSGNADIFNKSLSDNDLVNIESNGLVLKFSSKGGFLYEIFDKQHNIPLSIQNIGLVKEWSDFDFIASSITRGITFTYKNVDGLEIKKTFRVKEANDLELTIELSGITNSNITAYSIYSGSFNVAKEKDQASARYFEACSIINGITNRKAVYGLKNTTNLSGHVLWAGLRDRYFCTVLVPQVAAQELVMENLVDNKMLYIRVDKRQVDSQSSRLEDTFKIYVGPQDEKLLRSFGSESERIISYGTFDTISKALLFFLKLGFKITKNWGLAIILITIFVYFLLFPLSMKSMVSMRKMQSLQPKIEALRAKHKDSPQKLNMEIMQLYKSEKVNPFGGCIPMLLQIPVFFALYQLLMRFISLRDAKFLWIKDLAEPDRLVIFPTSLPVFGNELNILPLLMAGTMFLQQKTTAQVSSSPESAQQQKIMMIMMPILFGILFYKLPSGLVLYWFINSLLMTAFQWKITKTTA
ncbi:MAG TPA: membrane protein insertase YidC [Candidatus Omnitrophota bacterium]|nr:membrane protein insertase YidC [Candidatus Omnitrophota bacterium]